MSATDDHLAENATDSESSGSPGGPARGLAFALLRAVLRRGRTLEQALLTATPAGAEEGASAAARLDPRDRAFARLMASTTLRRLGQIDALIDHCLDHPLPRRAAGVHDLLRLGTCQLVFLGTPPHAAVDRMVELAASIGHARFKGLVNAVLRRLAREGAALAEAQDAARLNTPDWLWRSWCRAYGDAVCDAIAASHLEQAPLDITVRRDAAVWAEMLHAALLPTGSLRRAPGGAVERLPGYEEGAWWVQDAAAALPARLLDVPAGAPVLDLCAAPGGKTAQLAAAGARVTAVDRSAKRLKRLEANLARLDLTAELIVADVALWLPPMPVSHVLLDAPCTGTGTIRRHPDIARVKGAADVVRLSRTQDRLLAAAVDMTAPGGVLVYTTCSLQPEEGPARIAALLAQGAPVARDPVRPEELPDLAQAITPEGAVRTLPCHWPAQGGLDGFYAARLRRL